jgi:hypothetical protein
MTEDEMKFLRTFGENVQHSSVFGAQKGSAAILQAADEITRLRARIEKLEQVAFDEGDATDTVTRLDNWHQIYQELYERQYSPTLFDAMTEITRLRARVAELKSEIVSLRPIDMRREPDIGDTVAVEGRIRYGGGKSAMCTVYFDKPGGIFEAVALYTFQCRVVKVGDKPNEPEPLFPPW